MQAACTYHLRVLLMALLTTWLPLTIQAQPVKIMDDRGEQSFNHRPERVVVLNWELLEQVLELGVTPVGAPNIEGYRKWVVQPAVPDGVADIGTRAEPNLEKVAALKPDVIVAALPHQDLIARLERIAPVVYFENFLQGQQHADVAIHNFQQLARLFGRQEQAEQKLRDMDRRFSILRQQLQDAFHGQLPEVVTMRILNPTTTLIFTGNSITQYALNRLGLTPVLALPAARWGVSRQRLTDLRTVSNGYVLYVKPFPQEQELTRSVLWRAMPFVRQGHVNAMSAVWSYGGAMSALYIAESVTQGLLEIAPGTKRSQ